MYIIFKKRKVYSGWWFFTNPSEKICSSKWVHLPQKIGVNIPKIFELPPPVRKSISPSDLLNLGKKSSLRISRDLKSLVETGDPRTLRKTHPNPSFLEGPMILRDQHFLPNGGEFHGDFHPMGPRIHSQKITKKNPYSLKAWMDDVLAARG